MLSFASEKQPTWITYFQNIAIASYLLEIQMYNFLLLFSEQAFQQGQI